MRTMTVGEALEALRDTKMPEAKVRVKGTLVGFDGEHRYHYDVGVVDVRVEGGMTVVLEVREGVR